MLNKHNLNVYKACSKEESRFTLNGIYVSPTRTAATDGCRLLACTMPTNCAIESALQVPGCTNTAEFKPFLLPTAACVEIGKAIPRKTTLPVLEMVQIGSESDGDTRAVLAAGDLENVRVFHPQKLPGNFPDIDRVIPLQEKTEFSIKLNAKLLKEMAEQFEKFSDGLHLQCVTMSFTTPDNAVRFDGFNGTTGQNLVGVLMPVRGDKLVSKVKGAKDTELIPPDTFTKYTAIGDAAVKLLQALTSDPAALQVLPKFLGEIAEVQKAIQGATAPPEWTETDVIAASTPVEDVKKILEQEPPAPVETAPEEAPKKSGRRR
jgi:hypothetical protein